MIHTVAGDTLSFKAELIDGETGEEIDSFGVSNVWVAMNSLRFTLASAEVTLDPNAVRVSLSREQTQSLEGHVRVYIKVGMFDGRLCTVVRGEAISFTKTPLTRSS